MRVNSINNVNLSYNKVRSKKSESTTKVGADQSVGFQGYHSVYKEALNKDFGKSYSKVQRTFYELFDAAKNEPGTTKKFMDLYSPIGMRTMLRNFAACGKYEKEEIVRSSRYPSPLITASDGILEFHDPINGEFGAGSIHFWFANDGVVVSRPKDYHSFYANERIKRYHEFVRDGGGIINEEFYNKDGSRSFWKHFFFG